MRLLTRDGRTLPLRPFTAVPGSMGWGSIIKVTPTDVARMEFVRAGIPVMVAEVEGASG